MAQPGIDGEAEGPSPPRLPTCTARERERGERERENERETARERERERPTRQHPYPDKPLHSVHPRQDYIRVASSRAIDWAG